MWPKWTPPNSPPRPIVRSSTESWVWAAHDVGSLVRFRVRTIRRRWAAAAAVLVMLALTGFFATTPADLTTVTNATLADLVEQLVSGLQGNLGPTFAAVVALSVASASGGGGGRELLSRSEMALHPVGPRAEHLGALVLSPLNLTWLVQVWGLLAATALVAAPQRVASAQVVVVLWVLAATALGQALGWTVEAIRRLEYGVVALRIGLGLLGLGVAALHLAGVLLPLIRALPTTWIAETAVGPDWPLAALVCAVVAVVAVWIGAFPAAWALGLPPREELRVASGVHEARHLPAPRWISVDLALLIRLDRGSVWRSVGMRRGLIVLGVGPGVVALVAGMPWSSVLILPGLSASGAVLLFAVNAWSLDGKGMVWRETLPVDPALVWRARVWVSVECLVVVMALTVVVASLRNGLPTAPMGVAVLSCWVVVLVQVLAVAMTWSTRNPFGVDLASPRATPAPHAMMAGYAGRLSLVTTMMSLLFTALAALPLWWGPLVVAFPSLAWSLWRLRRARRRWLDPVERARVVLTVAAV